MPPTNHPLDPLSAEEMSAAVELVRADERWDDGMSFSLVVLLEPTRMQLKSAGGDIDRMAEVVLLDRRQASAHRLVVNVSSRQIVSWAGLDHRQPPIVEDEFIEMEEHVRADERVREALRRRGLTEAELDLVAVDPVSAGNYGEDFERERRVSRGLLYVRDEETDNQYAHPIEGLAVTFDLHRREIVLIEDIDVFPVPREPGNFSARYQDRFRDDLKPLDIVQPEGPSFVVDGWQVRWQKWRFRVGFNQREGMTLHQIEYDDEGVVRPVLFRASVAEMTVPYSDVAFTQRRKAAFDVGEYGLGSLANSLELGCDCLGEIYYFDSCTPSSSGAVEQRKNVICLHEEDAGVLWKHLDYRTQEVDVRRSRRLVISFFCTVGNYEYGFYWYFQQDGTIEHEVKATGIVQTGVLRDESLSPRYGVKLGSLLYAPHHQHFFCYRLDPQIDGDENRVVEVETQIDPMGPDNPYGNAFYPVRRVLETEQQAQRRVNSDTARSWLIENGTKTNALGGHPSYKLVPGENCLPFMDQESAVAKRAGYLQNHLWVTPFDEEERFPAGDYPNQSPGGEGLPAWTAADRPVVDRDIVVWYVLGHHHLVRPEDWPVMPVARMGFSLKPVGFFTRNPALDVAPPSHCAHNGEHG